MSLVSMSTLLYAFLWFWMDRENRRRDTLQSQFDSASDDEELGDESVNFRYTI